MSEEQRGPVELMDQMYIMAYWMTGSLKKTNNLVYTTYKQADSDISEIELFRTFRKVFLEQAASGGTICRHGGSRATREDLVDLLRQEEMDSRLTVLLSEICGLSHRAISMVLCKPLGTIRLWLSSGRKSLVDGLLVLLAMACCEPALAC